MQTCCDPGQPCLWGAAAAAAASAACCRPLFRGQRNPSSTRLSMPPDCRMDIMANVLLAAGASPAMVRRHKAPRPADACAPARLPFWRNAAALAMAPYPLVVLVLAQLQPPARNAITHCMPALGRRTSRLNPAPRTGYGVLSRLHVPTCSRAGALDWRGGGLCGHCLGRAHQRGHAVGRCELPGCRCTAWFPFRAAGVAAGSS